MIPTIGIMVGLYIITRMVALATRAGDRAETSLVKVLAVLTAVVTVFCTASLLLSGSGRLPLLGSGASQHADTPISAAMNTVAPAPEPWFDPSNPIQLELVFTKDCWVEAVMDRTRRLSELRIQGETLRLSARDSISLTLGNTNAVRATVNGKRLDLGKGEVVRDLLIDKNSIATKRGPA